MNPVRMSASLGKCLARLAEASGITNDLIAERSGLPVAQVAAYLAGDERPTYAELKDIMYAVGITAEEFLLHLAAYAVDNAKPLPKTVKVMKVVCGVEGKDEPK